MSNISPLLPTTSCGGLARPLLLISKSVRDLDHKNTYDLETGMALTAEWMRDVYRDTLRPKEDIVAPIISQRMRR